MSDFTPEQLEAQFHRLPDIVKESIVSFESAKAIKEISDKHSLHIDEAGILADETGYVMLGLTRPYMFPTRLTHALGISADKANAIATEVDEKIFREIQDFLKNPNIHIEKSDATKPAATIFDRRMTETFTPPSKTESTSPNPAYETPSHSDPYRETL